MNRLSKWSVCLLCPALLAGAEAVLIGDATVRSGFPYQNFGALPQIAVDGGAMGLVQFDLGAAIPAGTPSSSVVKAMLKLFVNRVAIPGQVSVNLACGVWAEAAVTHFDRPIPCTTASILADVSTGGQFVTVDATASVKLWLSGQLQNNGFLLSGVGAASVFFDSKESSTTSQPAQLSIVLAGPKGDPGPSGPPGPTGAQGTTGAQGPPGLRGSGIAIPAGWSSRSGHVAVGSALIFSNSCVAGTRLISGGCLHDASASAALYLNESGPSDVNTWQCKWNNNTLARIDVQIWILCATIVP